MAKFVLAMSLLVLVACGSKQTQDSTQLVHAQEAVLESSQDAIQARGANVEGTVETVRTENITGVPVEWFIIGALVFGLIIPQPKLLRGIL
jgi:uncharacterized protein YcfL